MVSSKPLVRPGIVKLMQWIVIAGLVNAAIIFCIQRMTVSIGFDFVAYYGAAMAVRDGQNLYSLQVIQHVALAHHQPPAGAAYLYPPLLAVLLVPVTFIPYMILLRFWFVLSLCTWLGSVWLLSNILRKATGNTWMLLVSSVVLTYGPMHAGLDLGQLSPIIAFGCIMLLWLDINGKDRWAGFVLALLSWLKLFPIILLGYYAIRGRWDIVRSSGISLALLGLGQLLIVGWSGFQGMISTTLRFAAKNSDWSNESLRVIPNRIGALWGITFPDVLGALISIGVFSATAHGVWKNRKSPDIEHHILGFSWCLCALILIIPTAWDHYYAWLLPACVFGVVYCLHYQVEWWALALISAGYCLTLYELLPQSATTPAMLTLYTSLRPIGALLLWIGVWRSYLFPAKWVNEKLWASWLYYAAGTIAVRLVLWAPLFVLAALGIHT